MICRNESLAFRQNAIIFNRFLPKTCFKIILIVQYFTSYVWTESHIFHIKLKTPFSLILQIWLLLSFLDTVTILVTDLTSPNNFLVATHEANFLRDKFERGNQFSVKFVYILVKFKG